MKRGEQIIRRRQRTCLVLAGITAIAMFWCGPMIIRCGFRRATSEADLSRWQREYQELDANGANEQRRLELIHTIRRRGVKCDEGLRDESVEHDGGVYAAIVMKKWEWEDLFE